MKHYTSWNLENMAQTAVSGKGWLHSYGIEVGTEGTFLVCYYKPNNSPRSGWTPEQERIEL
jgi:hypothetical protein